MIETPLRKTGKNKGRLITVSFLIIFSLLVIFSSVFLVISYFPSFQPTNLNKNDHIEIYYMGNKVEQHALVKDSMLYLPLNFFKNEIDPNIFWDEQGKMAIITTEKNVFHFPLGHNDGLLNLEPYSFTYPIVEQNGIIYLPIEPIQQYYDIEIEYIEENAVVMVHDLSQPVQNGMVLKQTKLREMPTYFSPWLTEIEPNTDVAILKETDGWYWVETNVGTMGYVNKTSVKLTEIATNPINKEVYQPWNPIGEPIVLTWEYASNSTVNPQEINDLTGVQVVSPTWFHLQKDGLVKNVADIQYVEWAHQKGYQVWGLFSNSFEPDLTHEMLNDPALRIKVIKQILSYVDLYQLDGINIDFENVHLKDKELLVHFIRELTPLLHEKQRTVSMDITFISESENWSMFYDRKRLAEVVDYLIVMAYDEHWASSPVAGSVASLPWVEKGLKRILDEVPNDKVILGVPFYTRLWIEEKDENHKIIRVSSKTLTMAQTDKWISENQATVQYDPISGQNYVEVNKERTTYKIWIEDDLSMQKRIELMKKYRLAGVAAWRRGFETEELWPLLAKMIDKPY